MKKLLLLLVAIATAPRLFAQESTVSQVPGATVPRLVSYHGTLKDATGKPVTGPVPVTFSLFAEREGGATLWSEIQIIQPDVKGDYTVLLGAASADGLPQELFSSGAARWLAVEPSAPAEGDASRTLLSGVPYALKAVDADTLGGKPASAFLTADSLPKIQSSTPSSPLPAPAVLSVPTPLAAIGGTGTANYVPLWTNSTTLGNSILSQGSGYLNVAGGLHIPSGATATPSKSFVSNSLDLEASVYNSSLKTAVPQHFIWRSEPVNNNSSSATGNISLAYAAGAAFAFDTGFSINSKGVVTFAPGQTFPGTGPGTIDGVKAGSYLTGGGNFGIVTLNLDTTRVPLLTANNNFTGNQSITGSLKTSGDVNASGTLFSSGVGWFNGGAIVTGNGLTAVASTDCNQCYAVNGVADGATKQTWGVWGFTRSPMGSGVYGQQVGASAEGARVLASLGASGAVWGDTNQDSTGAVLGTADVAPAGGFFNNSDVSATVYIENDYSNPATSVPFTAFGAAGNCTIDGSGDLYCTGSKSAVVPVDNGSRKVALYAVEAPENWFEDFGSGQLSSGAALVSFETTFAQTVNTGVDYHVFLTPKGDCKGLYITSQNARGFEVRELGGGSSNVAFDYRIVARRKGYENIRLADKTEQMQKLEALHAKLHPRSQAKGN